MNRKPDDSHKTGQGKDDGALEKMAQFINPPSREVTNDELADPGKNIPSSDRTLNESGKGLDHSGRRPPQSK
jgi:hypothetical protein